jgi:hypothetical protein
MAWLTVASASLDSDGAGLANITFRQRIEAAGLTNAGLEKWRVTLMAGSTEGLNISKAYIGQAADSGDAYDFAGTPTQLLFGGNANILIGAGSTTISDEVLFTLTSGKNLIISFFIANDTAHDIAKYKTTLANWQYYFKVGDDAATVNATGYTTATNDAIAVSLIEAFEGGAQVIIWSSE